MNNSYEVKIISADETFTRGTYNGIPVLIHDKDGFINVTEMCEYVLYKNFENIYENSSWQQYLDAFKAKHYANSNKEPIYQLKHYKDEVGATYVDPRLIDYIAIWASPKYASYVCETMNAFNELIHEVLKNEQLPDIQKYAKPLLVKIVDVENNNNNEKALRFSF